MRWSEWKEMEYIGGDISHTPTPTPTFCLEYSNFYWGNSWIFILDQDLFNMFVSGKNPWFQSFFYMQKSLLWRNSSEKCKQNMKQK